MLAPLLKVSIMPSIPTILNVVPNKLDVLLYTHMEVETIYGWMFVSDDLAACRHKEIIITLLRKVGGTDFPTKQIYLEIYDLACKGIIASFRVLAFK